MLNVLWNNKDTSETCESNQALLQAGGDDQDQLLEYLVRGVL